MVNLLLGLILGFAGASSCQDPTLDADALRRVDRMKEIFHTLGVRGPLQLKSYLRGGFIGGAQVVLLDRSGATHTAMIGRWMDGTRRISIDKPKEFELARIFPREVLYNPSLERQARIWATRLAPHEELKFDGLWAEHNGKLATASEQAHRSQSPRLLAFPRRQASPPLLDDNVPPAPPATRSQRQTGRPNRKRSRRGQLPHH
jgi:hypothetical protein